MKALDDFKAELAGDDVRDRIREGLIGEDVRLDGPFGERPLVYADYVASGRALEQVEDFIRDSVLPYYANTHTQASYCGEYMTRLREAAREEIARLTGAGAGMSVVFTGAGSTAGINRIVGLLELEKLVRSGERVVVVAGPYEHHSNILPWRETGADVIEIAEAESGGVDLADLERVLKTAQGASQIVGTFSAASNVSGILTDVDAVTRLLRAYGALAIWDYGCAGPYCAMDMKHGTDAEKDAIVFSPHKFPGGPGASLARRVPPSDRWWRPTVRPPQAVSLSFVMALPGVPHRPYPVAGLSVSFRPGGTPIPKSFRRGRKAARPMSWEICGRLWRYW